MNWKDLLQSALILVFSFALRWFLGAIGVAISEELFATLVAAMVVWLLGLFGVEVARAAKLKGIR